MKRLPVIRSVSVERRDNTGDHDWMQFVAGDFQTDELILQNKTYKSTFRFMISSTATYALRAAVFLASQPTQYKRRLEISSATLVPHDYLLKVLSSLETAQIVESRRGPGGGYRLCRSPDELTSLEVVLAVDRIPRITECPLGISDHERLCPLHQLLDDAARRVEDAFAETKISDLLPGKRSRKCDFPIIKLN